MNISTIYLIYLDGIFFGIDSSSLKGCYNVIFNPSNNAVVGYSYIGSLLFGGAQKQSRGGG